MADDSIQQILSKPITDRRRANWENSNKKKNELLGMAAGTAFARLRKSLLFAMARRLGEHICFRCRVEILTVEEFSVEHKDAWQRAADPVAAFFAIENVAYSHLACNILAGRKPTRLHVDDAARKKAWDQKAQPIRVQRRKKWRARRREAGRPYT